MTQNEFQTQTSNTKITPQDKVDTLASIVALRLDELLSELDVRLYKGGNKLVGACPIHGGKKQASFNLWPDGHTVPGMWKCRSHHCEETFKKTIIGLVRGVLSHQKYGWTKKGDKTVSFEETLHWCCQFINQTLDTLKVDKNEIERRRFANQVDSLSRKDVHKLEGIPRQSVKTNLEIPARYFIQRGFSPEVLSAYDVGLCSKQGREMESRVVVPVYDNSKAVMIGCTGRSIHPECKQCKCYHSPAEKCPSEEYKWLYSKWKNSKHFDVGSCLYNYWNAKKHIQESGVVILVEGPADVWRLEECGIHNAVALFGCELTEQQQVILETSGAMSVIILLDNDDAGNKGASDIQDTLKRFYNIFRIKPEVKDLGETPIEIVKSSIMPIIQNIQLRGKMVSF